METKSFLAGKPRDRFVPPREAALRTWTTDNPYRCVCGFMTGWRTEGKPLCPVCAGEQDEAYRQRMLGYAAKMEKAAMAMDAEKRAARLAVVAAVREEFGKHQSVTSWLVRDVKFAGVRKR